MERLSIRLGVHIVDKVYVVITRDGEILGVFRSEASAFDLAYEKGAYAERYEVVDGQSVQE